MMLPFGGKKARTNGRIGELENSDMNLRSERFALAGLIFDGARGRAMKLMITFTFGLTSITERDRRGLHRKHVIIITI